MHSRRSFFGLLAAAPIAPMINKHRGIIEDGTERGWQRYRAGKTILVDGIIRAERIQSKHITASIIDAKSINKSINW